MGVNLEHINVFFWRLGFRPERIFEATELRASRDEFFANFASKSAPVVTSHDRCLKNLLNENIWGPKKTRKSRKKNILGPNLARKSRKNILGPNQARKSRKKNIGGRNKTRKVKKKTFQGLMKLENRSNSKKKFRD